MTNRSILSTIAITALVAAAASPAQAAHPLPRSTPEAQGISSDAVREFIETFDRKVNTPHSVMVLRHGKVIADAYWKPETADKPHVLWSLSKSFCSTAAGFAVAEGKLSLDDPVLKFFPDLAPAEVSNNLKAMKVRHLLSMSGGHATEPKFGLDGGASSGPTVKGFLAHPVAHEPGTHFQYNTPGTYMVSAIVTKVTGQTVVDYLKPRLFEPLGIESPRWDASSEGYSLGGYGLFLKTEDIAKFGQLYLQKGKWNGKQILPEQWIEQATSKQVSNEKAGHAKMGDDWQQGYGFQFWRCTHNAYRGDGKDGQFCLVLPEQDTVIAITALTGNMQGELNVVWEKLLPAMGDKPLPENSAAVEKLKQAIDKLEAHPQTKAK
jgi:CubicO group peptidase (beta-lactamase class C family)